jgi:hypothetical protein
MVQAITEWLGQESVLFIPSAHAGAVFSDFRGVRRQLFTHLDSHAQLDLKAQLQQLEAEHRSVAKLPDFCSA